MKDLYEFPTDYMIATDEWDHVRYMIGEELKICDFKGTFLEGHLPFLTYYKKSLKDKLKKVGFKRETYEDPILLERAVKMLGNQGKEFAVTLDWLIDSLVKNCGVPKEAIIIDEDKKRFWIKPDVEAALRALELIDIMKKLLVIDGVVNQAAVKVYLRSLELIINLVRTGEAPGIVKAKIDADTNSKTTREIKKRVMKEAISNIFKLKPETKKTLGGIWKEFNTVNKDMTFYASKSDIHRLGKGGYTVKKGKDKKGNDAILILKDKESFCDPYAKRSLQHFIDELK